MFFNRYRPPDPSWWHGRVDAPTPQRVHERILCQNITELFAIDRPAFGILGFACDEGIFRNQGKRGAEQGPRAFREAFGSLPCPQATLYDCGDILCEDGGLELSQMALKEGIALLLRQGIFPLVIGGGHELAWGHYQGIREVYPNDRLTIINLDAHFDCRPFNSLGTSGTSFSQIYLDCKENQREFDVICLGLQEGSNTEALFARAKEMGMQYVTSSQFPPNLDLLLSRSEKIYLTICLDVFAFAFAPGVSAPQPLGIMPSQALPILEQIFETGKLISFDIAELSPKFDRDQMTAALAAQLALSSVKKISKAFTSLSRDC